MSSVYIPGGHIYPRSITEHDGNTYFIVKMDTGTRYLGIQGNADGFTDVHERDDGIVLVPLTPGNAAQIRRRRAQATTGR